MRLNITYSGGTEFIPELDEDNKVCIYAPQNIIVNFGEGKIEIPTGLRLYFPCNYIGVLYCPLQGVDSWQIIEDDCEIIISLRVEKPLCINRGECVAKIIFQPIEDLRLEHV